MKAHHQKYGIWKLDDENSMFVSKVGNLMMELWWSKSFENKVKESLIKASKLMIEVQIAMTETYEKFQFVESPNCYDITSNLTHANMLFVFKWKHLIELIKL